MRGEPIHKEIKLTFAAPGPKVVISKVKATKGYKDYVNN